MTVQTGFAAFLDHLPESSLPSAGTTPVPALRAPAEDPAFVPPPLLRRTASLGTCPIALVSAPGAMGKTTVANAVAARKSAWVWDLGSLRLGDNSFVGTVAAHFGARQLGGILERIAGGELLFLFDAFDEAEILSGWDRVEAFVGELWSHLKESPRTAAVLFARGETAKLLEYVLEERTGGTSTDSVWELDFFDEPQAKQFVDHQVGRIRDGGLTPAYSALGQELFDLLMRRITPSKERSWEDPVVRSFLGYAPVLQAMGSLLAEIPNPSAAELSVALEDGRGANQNVLDDLLYGLLRREQEKVVGRLRKRLADRDEDMSALDSAYGPPEQMRRLLFFHAGLDEDFEGKPQGMDAWLAQEYEDAVKSFLPQHPFLRDRGFAGPAFRDYVLAYNLRQPEYAFMAESVLDQGQFVPTSLLFDFYRLAGPEGALGPGRHAGYLYESATAWAAGRLETQTLLIAPSNGEGHHLEIRRQGDDRQPESVVSVQLDVASGMPVAFRRRLMSALIDVRGPVILGPAGGEIELSDVHLRCEKLIVTARAIRVRAGRTGDEVVLAAGEYSHTAGTLLVDKKGDGILSVDWPGGEHHPWSPYYKARPADEKYDRSGAALALYRILRWMRRDGKEELAKFSQMIDNVVAAGQEIRQEMLQYLLDTGVLRFEAEMYVLDSAVSGSVGINWSDLRQGRVSAQLGQYLDEFVRSRRSQGGMKESSVMMPSVDQANSR